MIRMINVRPGSSDLTKNVESKCLMQKVGAKSIMLNQNISGNLGHMT